MTSRCFQIWRSTCRQIIKSRVRGYRGGCRGCEGDVWHSCHSRRSRRLGATQTKGKKKKRQRKISPQGESHKCVQTAQKLSSSQISRNVKMKKQMWKWKKKSNSHTELLSTLHCLKPLENRSIRVWFYVDWLNLQQIYALLLSGVAF